MLCLFPSLYPINVKNESTEPKAKDFVSNLHLRKGLCIVKFPGKKSTICFFKWQLEEQLLTTKIVKRIGVPSDLKA